MSFESIVRLIRRNQGNQINHLQILQERQLQFLAKYYYSSEILVKNYAA